MIYLYIKLVVRFTEYLISIKGKSSFGTKLEAILLITIPFLFINFSVWTLALVAHAFDCGLNIIF